MVLVDSFTVHDIPKQKRPRERLKKYGPEVLSAQKLLVQIIIRGTTWKVDNYLTLVNFIDIMLTSRT